MRKELHLIASTIDIRFNQNDEAPVNLQEEAPDVAVVYTEPTSATEPVYWPSHIPESIDKTQLQNLDGFKLNGFWHSADGNYVYQIFTSGYDTGLTNTLHYVNLNGSDKVNAGKVVQTSSFGLILKANEDSGEKFEVLAVNNQLISDEITLQRTEDYVASQLLGTWGNDDWTYTFNSDGTYNVSRTRGDSYWGYYFVVDEANIVLTKNVHDCRLREYRIEGNSLWIDNWDALIR